MTLLHSGVSLILEVNGRSSDGNFNLQCLAGPSGNASNLHREAFISATVNAHRVSSAESECEVCVSPPIQTTDLCFFFSLQEASRTQLQKLKWTMAFTTFFFGVGGR